MSAEPYLDIAFNPHYLQGSQGRLFCLSNLPDNKQAPILLFLPSFAEELNRCRVMVAMQARRFVEKGYGCLLLDYYGTGDSEGDFSETSWEQWRDDVMTAYIWLTEQGYRHVILWGLRVGALLAAELAQESPQRFKHLLLWQPVLDGQTVLTQFFRIRVAMLMDRGEPKETTRQMRERLQQGSNLEIAGYVITPRLAQALDSKKLPDFSLPGIQVDWFEATMDGMENLTLISQKVIEDLRSQGALITPYLYQGPAFWQLHERELTPDLLEKTTALF